MWRLWLLPVLQLAMSHDIDDPCWFVGMYLAKTHSICVNNECSGIHWLENRAIVAPLILIARISYPVSNVTCEEAAGLKESVVNSVPYEPSADPTKKIQGILEDVRTLIVPAGGALVYSNRRIGPMTLFGMRRVHDTILSLMKNQDNWPQIRRELLGSSIMEQLNHVSYLLSQLGINTPNSFDVHTGLTADFTHFVVDIGSFLGFGTFTDSMLLLRMGWTTVAQMNVVNYRLPGPMELNIKTVEAHLGAQPQQLWMAKVLSQFVDTMNNNPQSVPYADLLRMSAGFTVVLSRINIDTDNRISAADAIVRYQLVKEVCPWIERVLEMIDMKEVWRKLGISLIELCSATVGTFELARAARCLVSIQPTNPIPAGSSLMSSSVPWINGVDPNIGDQKLFVIDTVKKFLRENDPVSFVDGLGRFKPAKAFSNRDHFEATNIAFGRAIGLCIRHGIAVGDILTMDIIMAVAIRQLPENEELYFFIRYLKLTDQLDPALAVQELVFEPVYYIRIGIRDVLGPAGLYMFPRDVWMRYFLSNLGPWASAL